MKIPTRTCVACRKQQPKKELLRVVKTPEGDVKLDFTGRAHGRGAYICNNDVCIETAVKKKAFNREFKINIEADVYTRLLEEYREHKQS
ncbi:MAG TPA: YlxR family protein [Clostridia bacterium]